MGAKRLTSRAKRMNLAIVCSAQRTALNAARLARPILGTVRLGRWSEARARDRFPGARALWKAASPPVETVKVTTEQHQLCTWEIRKKMQHLNVMKKET